MHNRRQCMLVELMMMIGNFNQAIGGHLIVGYDGSKFNIITCIPQYLCRI